MHINILRSQTDDGFRIAGQSTQAGVDGFLESWKIAKEVIVRHLKPEFFPQRFDGIHVWRIFRKKGKCEPFVFSQPRSQFLGFVPNGIVQDQNNPAARTVFQDVPQKSLELASVDGGGQAVKNASANGVDGAKDMGFAMVSRPSTNADLMASPAPGSRQCGVELDSRFVAKENGQAAEVPGAAHKNRQRSFFLARSRGSLPGRSCVGRKRRHPSLWS